MIRRSLSLLTLAAGLALGSAYAHTISDASVFMTQPQAAPALQRLTIAYSHAADGEPITESLRADVQAARGCLFQLSGQDVQAPGSLREDTHALLRSFGGSAERIARAEDLLRMTGAPSGACSAG